MSALAKLSGDAIVKLEAHPLAELFPMADDETIEGIAQDIDERGFREDRPVIILDGMILDGRNRRAAAVKANADIYIQEFDGEDGTELDFVLSENLHRRHLTTSQRAVVGANLAQWDLGLNQHSGGSANLPTQRQVADRLSISERALRAAKNIRDNGSAELVQAISSGKITVHAGEALIELGDKELAQTLVLERRDIIARAKEIREENGRVSRNQKLAKVSAIAEAGKAKNGEWPRNVSIGYFDVPWKNYVHNEENGHEKSPEMHYPTMTNEEILAYCSGDRDPFADDAILFFWATGNRLDIAIDIIRKWGFTFKSSMVWDKENAGTGRWVRDQFEPLLIASRGSGLPCPLPGENFPSVYREKKGKHSVKPQFFAQMIDDFFPDVPKVEFFNRRDLLPDGDIRLHTRGKGQWQFVGWEA